MNRMERFTNRARQALSLAQEGAEKFQHSSIDTEHLLLGLVREEGGIAGSVLHDLGLNRQQVERLVKELGDSGKRSAKTQPELSPGVRQTLEKAVDQARRMGHPYIGTEHLLLGLLEQKNSTAMTILDRMGIDAKTVRQYTLRKLEHTDDEHTRLSNVGYPLADERRKVLDMVDEGKITALEGAELLKHLQVVATPFPMGMGWMHQFTPLGSTPIEQMQKRTLRFVVRKGDETQFELRHPFLQVASDYMILLNRFYSGEVGKIFDLKADDKTIDVYIDEAEDEDEE
jgi:hypothetical protein